MNTIKAMLTLLSFGVSFANSAFAGTWVRTDNATVTFRGSIETGELEKFKAVFDEEVKTLIVTSAGGAVHDAIEIAETLEQHDIKIVVRIWCLSSCANYLFTSAKTRVIEKGIVGFHGSANACLAEDLAEENLDKLREKYRNYGLTPENIEREITRKRDLNRRELSFFTRLGISQDLFVRTCTSDKGMNDGNSYSFLLPTKSTFERYGIMGVIGTQDQETIEWYIGNLIVN